MFLWLASRANQVWVNVCPLVRSVGTLEDGMGAISSLGFMKGIRMLRMTRCPVLTHPILALDSRRYVESSKTSILVVENPSKNQAP